MSLRAISDIQDTVSESSVKCPDDEERDVIVRISGEAVREFGWGTSFEVANDMFDAGRFNDKKNPEILTVKAQDVKDWMASRD